LFIVRPTVRVLSHRDFIFVQHRFAVHKVDGIAEAFVKKFKRDYMYI